MIAPDRTSGSVPLLARPWTRIGLAAALAFVGLAWLVGRGALLQLDLAVVEAAPRLRTPLVAVVGELFNVLVRADLLLLAAALGALLALRAQRPGLAVALLLVVPMTAFEVACKHFVAVPDEAVETLNAPLQHYLPGARLPPAVSLNPPYTFPSGHAARLSYSLGLGLMAARRRSGRLQLAAGLAVLIGGLTRLTELQHLLSDVLGGYLLALVTLALSSAALAWERGRTGRPPDWTSGRDRR